MPWKANCSCNVLLYICVCTLIINIKQTVEGFCSRCLVQKAVGNNQLILCIFQQCIYVWHVLENMCKTYLKATCLPFYTFLLIRSRDDC
jgi:hypothetical protein